MSEFLVATLEASRKQRFPSTCTLNSYTLYIVRLHYLVIIYNSCIPLLVCFSKSNNTFVCVFFEIIILFFSKSLFYSS